VFCIDVVKVVQDIAYIAMAIHASVCFKCFIYFFRSMLQVFLFKCYICFTHIFVGVFVGTLHMCCNVFSSVFDVFASVLDACIKCLIFLQMYVAKVSFGCFKTRSGVVHIAM
jgi:hypothetical protein